MSQRTRIWLLVATLAVALLPAVPARAAHFVVDGFELDRQVDVNGSNYRSYSCHPSDDYAGAIECTREQQKQGQAATLTVTSTLIHAVDGPALYAAVHVAPVKLKRATLEKEIRDLTAAIGAPPVSVEWSSDDAQVTTVVAWWGAVELGTAYPIEPADVARPGALVDTLADPERSDQRYLPVYKPAGGSGYIYAASFDNADGLGDRSYIAVNPKDLEPRHYRSELRAIVDKDRTLAADDYSLWPELALAARSLALLTSAEEVDAALDAICAELGSSKLQSHVWSIMPTGAIQRLGLGRYWRYDVYGPRTGYPEVRAAASNLIANAPNDRFIDLAYFLIGDFDGALKANPNSVIANVLHYAIGFQTVQGLVAEAMQVAKSRVSSDEDAYLFEGDPEDPDPYSERSFSVDQSLSFLSNSADVFNDQPLATFVPDFSSQAAAAREHFRAVSGATTLSDDAAYMGAFLDMQTGDLHDALRFLSKGMATERAHADDDFWWTDYQGALHRQALRVLDTLPPQELVPALQSDEVLSSIPSLWYASARSAYRKFDYARTIDIATAALNGMGMSIDQLPATTDPTRIRDTIARINPKLLEDLNVVELPYLLEASREMGDYEAALTQLGSEEAQAFSTRARKLIAKYSMLVDRPADAAAASEGKSPAHKDLRQALHLIAATLARTADDPAYDGLREWLLYRQVRIVAVTDPNGVPDAIASLEAAFPSSDLLDDALAEDVFAKGMVLKDVDAAKQAFETVLKRTPQGNAVDNAYSWMEIILTCEGFTEEAAYINSEIIRLFPLTRHAKYAIERASDPERSLDSCYSY